MTTTDPRTDHPAVAAARRLCEGFTARDWSMVDSALDEEIYFAVGGSSPLAGEHKGRDAVVALIRRMVELSDDTLHFVRPDVYDILVSQVHAAILVPFVGERNGRKLDSYQMWQFHSGERLGGYGGIYLVDQAGFDAFWS